MAMFDDPARIDTTLDTRSISFENPSGARGRGGTAAGGRKGAPSRDIQPGEKVVLADVAGMGRVRHIWMTFPPATPEHMRAVWMEVYYDGLAEPSISVPCLDFFGTSNGRPAAYCSALTAVQEGRGFNAYFPMPFGKRLRIELTNSGPAPISLFYQIDYALEEIDADAGYLHVTFRRENPTTLTKDFVIADCLQGPGRFLGCVVGIRILKNEMVWYGEGEFKVYLDGDDKLPTICGTGLEDYVGSAWGLGRHTTFYAGVPALIAPAEQEPDFVSFYRWHLADPIVFRDRLKATIQQIGIFLLTKEQKHLIDTLSKKYQIAGNGWITGKELEGTPYYAVALAERSDDYSAAAFLYCRSPQPVPRLDVKAAVADIGRRDYEPSV